MEKIIPDKNLTPFGQYQSVYNYYKKYLGSKIAVLMQVGTMYELYTLDEDCKDLTKRNNVVEVVNLLGFDWTKNDRDITEQNPKYTGFPVKNAPKHVGRLGDAGYAVVLVDQIISGNSKNKTERKVVDIITQGVRLNDNSLAPNIISIFIENQNPKVSLFDSNSRLKSLDNLELIIGIASISATTNESKIFEIANSKLGESGTTTSLVTDILTEVFRFLQSTPCKELIVNLVGFNFGDIVNESIIRKNEVKRYFFENLSLSTFPLITFEFNQIPDLWTTPKYQNDVLTKIYPKTNKVGIKPLEILHLDRMNNAVTALLITVEHIRVRNETLLIGLSEPLVWNTDANLILTHNAIQQLDLCPSTSIDMKSNEKRMTLFEIIDNTSTADGKRLLEQLLFAPYSNVELLNKKYNEIDHWLKLDNCKQLIDEISKHLRNVVDLRKFHRKIELNMLPPSQLGKLMKSYESIQKLIQIDNTHKLLDISLPNSLTNNSFEEFQTYCESLQAFFNYDILNNCKSYKSININVLNPGIDERSDELYNLATNVKARVENFTLKLARIIDSDMTEDKALKTIQIKCPNVAKTAGTKPKNGNNKTYLKIPLKIKSLLEYYQNKISESEDNCVYKYQTFDDFLYENRDDSTDIDIKNCHISRNFEVSESIPMTQEEIDLIMSLSFRTSGTYAKVFSNLIDVVESQSDKLLAQFTTHSTIIYHNLLVETHRDVIPTLLEITNWVSRFDILKSNVVTAQKNNYNKPLAEGSDEQPSYIIAKKMRHPIIEVIQNEIPFVPNDLTIGVSDTENGTGFLGLFLGGVNSAGKTTYLKSSALNTILAQCGMYAACESFVYHPFKNIITRLSGNDNMYKRQGSFAVEMSELRTVAAQSTPNTLILGDEICRGTEQKSALTIVASTVVKLCKKRTNFLFSTHLAMLDQFPEVMECQTKGLLKYAHFSIDSKAETAIFEYKLHDGIGANLYGIEIAEMMGLDKEICALAYEFRNRLEHPDTYDIPLGGNKKSRYNSESLMGLCSIKNCNGKAIDTHHIRFQSEANDKGQIDHFHKNILHNLVHLCEFHHHEIHHGDLKLEGYRQTAEGIQLISN